MIISITKDTPKIFLRRLDQRRECATIARLYSFIWLDQLYYEYYIGIEIGSGKLSSDDFAEAGLRFEPHPSIRLRKTQATRNATGYQTQHHDFDHSLEI